MIYPASTRSRRAASARVRTVAARRGRWTLPLVLGLALASPAAGEVTVIHKPPVVERRRFDPARPPAQMPKLHPGEAAVTESLFSCTVSSSYRLSSRHEQGGRCTANVEVEQVQMTLGLRIEVWLPEGAPEALRDHEEGHRQIAERVYAADADTVARSVGAKMDGRRFAVEGTDCEAAAQGATQTAGHAAAQDYLGQTGMPSARVNAIFDDLTAHGTKTSPTAAEAIGLAFEKYRAEGPPQARTQPAAQGAGD